MIFTLLGILVLYIGTVYAAPQILKPNAEPADSQRHQSVATAFMVAVFMLFAGDAALFHTHFYERILKTDSSAGGVALRAEAERTRQPSGLTEVAVLGDSRVVQGFSAQVADELASGKGYRFLNLASRGSYPRVWFYLLREIDPSANRYRSIVLPFKSDDSDKFGNIADRGTEISMAAPLLRYSDAFTFASSFRDWTHRYAAFTACLLRGSAYRADLADLLEHPRQRLGQARHRRESIDAGYRFAGRSENLAGLSYDPVSKKITFPPGTTQLQRMTIEENVRLLENDNGTTEQPGRWTDRIIERYAGSRTTVVLLRLPRGALASVIRPFSKDNVIPLSTTAAQHALVLDQHLFADVETPDHYFDGYHPNAKARQLITSRLVNELLTRLTSATAGGSKPSDASTRPTAATAADAR
jgi:hypothetical protein